MSSQLSWLKRILAPHRSRSDNSASWKRMVDSSEKTASALRRLVIAVAVVSCSAWHASNAAIVDIQKPTMSFRAYGADSTCGAIDSTRNSLAEALAAMFDYTEACKYAAEVVENSCSPLLESSLPSTGSCNYVRTKLYDHIGGTISWSTNPVCPDPAHYSYNSQTGLCEQNSEWNTSKDRGDPQCPQGNPINPATGNKFQVETDYVGPEGSLLRFERYYNSESKRYGTAGMNWSYGYFKGIRRYVAVAGNVVQDIVRATRSEGEEIPFRLDGQTWRPDSDVLDRLIELKASGGNTTGWEYHVRGDEQVETYDALGLLKTIDFRNGGALRFTYSDSTTSWTAAPFWHMLIKIEDDAGHVLKLTYNKTSLLDTLTDPSGGVYKYDYDGALRLTTVTFTGTGGQKLLRTYHYEDARFPFALTGITDAKGVRFASWTYDTAGRANSSEHAGGAERVDLVYNTDNSTTVTNALGRRATYQFQTIQGTRKIASVEGDATILCPATHQLTTYDPLGLVASTTDAKGTVNAYSHDSMGLEVSRTYAAGTPDAQTITTAWDTAIQRPTCIVEPSRTTRVTYGSGGRESQRITIDTSNAIRFPNEQSKSCDSIGAGFDIASPIRKAWQYTYTISGRVESVQGPRSDVSQMYRFAYDASNTLTSVTNALNQPYTVTSRDAHGSVLQVAAPNGRVTKLTYDERQNVASVSVGSDITGFATTIYDYDANGQLTHIALPSGEDVIYEYDAAHRLTAITNTRGERVEFQLDAAGNILKQDVKSSAGILVRTHQQAFDELSRLIQSIGAKNQLTEYDYDNNGNPLSVADPLLHTTLREFDALNRVTKITDAKQGVTTFTYNAQNRVTSVTDPRNVVTSYDLDGFGRVVKETSADRGVTTYSYDEADNLRSRTDARNMTTSYSYDALNRLTSVLYNDGSTATYAYDVGLYAIGHLSSITDASGTTTYSYDAAGRLVSKVQKVGSKTFTTAYSYDALGRVATMTYPSGMVVGYGYDAGRVTSITVNGNALLANIAYEPFGEVKGWTFGNNTAFSRTFDLDGQLTAQTMSSGTRTYTFDAAGNIKSLSDPIQSMTFTYDALDRLTKSTGIGRTFSYDANGNRLSDTKGTVLTTYNTDALSNRLLSTTSGTTTLNRSYDAAGNIVNDGTYQFVYDARGRMVQSLNSSNAVIGSYTLNDLGQRVKKVRGTATTYFVYDESGHLLGEYNGAGTVTQETIYLGDMPVGIWKGGARYYVHADHLNTPRAILDQNGIVIWLWKADPFGTTNPTADPDANGVTFAYNLRFPGQYYDQETGMFYNYFRDYDPRTGRYTQSDPIGLNGGLNTFAYVRANPVNLVDPSGLRPLTDREKKCLAPYIPQVDLDNADLHEGQVPWYLQDGYIGITRGNDIYFRPGVYDGTTAGGIALLGHELYHVGQYRNGATWLDFLREGRHGHDESSLEKPAIALEAQINKDIQGSNRNSNCECTK